MRRRRSRRLLIFTPSQSPSGSNRIPHANKTVEFLSEAYTIALIARKGGGPDAENLLGRRN